MAIAYDATAGGHKSNYATASGTTVASPSFSTAGATVLFAFVSSEGYNTGSGSEVPTLSNTPGDLTWVPIINVGWTGQYEMGAGCWYAIASSALTNTIVTATFPNATDLRMITVLPLTGVNTSDPYGASDTVTQGSAVLPSLAIGPIEAAGSWVAAVCFQGGVTSAAVADGNDTMLLAYAQFSSAFSEKRTSDTVGGDIGNDLTCSVTSTVNGGPGSRMAGCEILAGGGASNFQGDGDEDPLAMVRAVGFSTL